MSLRGLKIILQAAVCAVLLAGPASAVTIIESELAQGIGVVPLVHGEEYYGGNLHAPGDFTEFFNFSLASAPLGTITISAPAVIGAIANLQLAWLSAGGLVISPILTVTDAFGGTTPTDTLAFVLSDAVAYSLRVTGTALTGGGAYEVAISTTPIPPALLLFGSALAGLGFLGRRSRRRTAASPLA